MTKLFIFLCTMFVSASFAGEKNAEKKESRKTASAAMQTPMQQTSSVFEAAIKSIRSQNTLQLLQIRTLRFSNNSGKIELIDNNGKCSAYPMAVSFDQMGMNPTVKPMLDSLAVCD